jgi:hypothetical protein
MRKQKPKKRELAKGEDAICKNGSRSKGLYEILSSRRIQSGCARSWWNN